MSCNVQWITPECFEQEASNLVGRYSIQGKFRPVLFSPSDLRANLKLANSIIFKGLCQKIGEWANQSRISIGQK